MPNSEWFWAQVADALLAMVIPDNWEQVGSVTIDDAVSAASEVLMSFQSMCGAIFPVAWSTIPDGFLLCDGTTYLATDYPYLYSILPSAFIVDADHFKVPDLRGRVPVGVDGTFTLGSVGGEVDHTLTVAEIPAHDHSIPGTITSLAVQPGDLPVLDPSLFPSSTGSTGGGSAHNNLQPYLALQYVICSK